MGEFVRIIIDRDKCTNPDEIKSWARVCPVGVFEMKNGLLAVVEENVDECTFCGLCRQACQAGAVAIEKLYEQ